MNERIRELAKQAGLYHQVNDNNFYPTALSAEQSSSAYEKFALLIVRECANRVKDFYQEDEFTCYNAAEEIKQHFGVEE